MAQRYFVCLSYDGGNYVGWQRQANGNTVQQELEEKLSLVLKQNITIIGAGRTDTGVHAKNYIVHLDLDYKIVNCNDLMHKLNSFLNKDIAIHWIKPVAKDAHARFSAISRTYEYHITQEKDPFKRKYSLPVYYPLNLKAMQDASKILMEYSDFESFSKVKTDVNNFNCSISESYWKKVDNQLIYTIKANRFLRNMVRAIVGTLLEVGKEKTSLELFRKVIASQNRSMAGKSVDGKALFLVNIEYPNSVYLH